MKFLRAEIGVFMLSAYYVLVIVEMIVGIPHSFWVSFVDMMIGLAFCVHIAGLTLYISDRKSFLNRRSGSDFASASLAILGMIVIVVNVIDGVFSLWAWSFGRAHSPHPLTWEESRVYILTLALSGLGFLLGMLLLSDRGKILEDKPFYQLSRQKLDIESQIKYPKDLFAKYVERYPHNPEGVLEWHIDKKMRKGKTREQALKELENIVGRSI